MARLTSRAAAPRVLGRAPRLPGRALRLFRTASRLLEGAPRRLARTASSFAPAAPLLGAAPRLLRIAPPVLGGALSPLESAARLLPTASRLLGRAPRVLTTASRVLGRAPRLLPTTSRVLGRAPRLLPTALDGVARARTRTAHARRHAGRPRDRVALARKDAAHARLRTADGRDRVAPARKQDAPARKQDVLPRRASGAKESWSRSRNFAAGSDCRDEALKRLDARRTGPDAAPRLGPHRRRRLVAATALVVGAGLLLVGFDHRRIVIHGGSCDRYRLVLRDGLHELHAQLGEHAEPLALRDDPRLALLLRALGHEGRSLRRFAQPMIIDSDSSLPCLKRLRFQRSKRGRSFFSAMCWAMRRPITGAIMKPWPMKPEAW